MATLRNDAGVSLIEATLVLAVFAVLTSVLAPSAVSYIEEARQARTRQDLQSIADAISSFVEDNGELQFLQTAHGASAFTPPGRLDANRVNMLVSDGDVPTLGAGVAGETYWTQATSIAGIDTFANHLSQNTPADDPFGTLGYRNPVDISVGGGGSNIDFTRAESGGYNAPYAWRGSYLPAPVSADPWGNRYAANVAFLDTEATAVVTGTITAGFGVADYPRLDVFVLSAGADEEIDTRSAQDGAVPGDDDFIYIVTSNAR
jgi:type II secretory pathway pseudopilin PulG